MNHTRFLPWMAAVFLAIGLHGCCTDGRLESSDPVAHVEKGGAQLWAENCRRCHNLRPPTAFSHDEWEVIVNHMRTRAHLTANDSRLITEFLKAAN